MHMHDVLKSRLCCAANRRIAVPQHAGEGVEEHMVSARRGLSAKQKAVEFVYWLYLRMHLAWLAVCHGIIRTFAVWEFRAAVRADQRRYAKRKMPMRVRLQRKLVLIGDDIAYGVGDTVALSNVHPPGLLRTLPRPLTGLFFRWHYFACATVGSTTSDWLPDDRSDPQRATLSLFDQAFHPTHGIHPDADVVLIMLGFGDFCRPETTASNIVCIARELEKRSKFVLVVPPIVTEHIRSVVEPLLKLRYEQRIKVIKETIRRVWPEQDLSTTRVKLGTDVAPLMKQNTTSWSFRGRYPVSRTYRAWARVYQDDIFTISKAAEVPLVQTLVG